MKYCKGHKEDEPVDCEKCHIENNLKYEICCLDECGQHEFCRQCHNQ